MSNQNSINKKSESVDKNEETPNLIINLTEDSNDSCSETVAQASSTFSRDTNHHSSRSLQYIRNNRHLPDKAGLRKESTVTDYSSRRSERSHLVPNYLSKTFSKYVGDYQGYGNIHPSTSFAHYFHQNTSTFDGHAQFYSNNTNFSLSRNRMECNYVSFNRNDRETSEWRISETAGSSNDLKTKEQYDKEAIENIRKWSPVDVHVDLTRNYEGINFTLLSYNVLAQDLVQEHSYLYRRHHPRACTWETRWTNLFKEIKSYNADIICLQEVQETHLQAYYSQIENLGYGALYKKRTGHRTDGCAIYYRKSMFKLVENTTVEFNQDTSVLNRDNVAIIAKFVAKHHSSSQFVVATTHLLYNPRRMDVRLAQTQLLLTEVERIAYKGELGEKHIPIIITGDFNSEPDSAVYELIVNGTLDYEHRTNRTLVRSDSNTTDLFGKILIPPFLKITDYCQHYELLQSRLNGIKLTRKEEFQLINLRHSKRPNVQLNDFEVDNTLFSTGVLSHELNLKSAFLHRNGDDFEGTTFQNKWITVDFIFYSGKYDNNTKTISDNKLKLLSRYTIPTATQLEKINPIPNFALGSDHLALLSKFKLLF